MNEISSKDLRSRLSAGEDIQLVDVREELEHEAYNIGGTLVPLSSLLENGKQIPMDKPVVVYCQKGIRSQIAIQRLSQNRVIRT